MKVGISGIITPSEWTFEETLEKAKAAGYEAFELTFRDDRDTKFDDLTDTRIADMVKLAEDYEIELHLRLRRAAPGHHDQRRERTETERGHGQAHPRNREEVRH